MSDLLQSNQELRESIERNTRGINRTIHVILIIALMVGAAIPVALYIVDIGVYGLAWLTVGCGTALLLAGIIELYKRDERSELFYLDIADAHGFTYGRTTYVEKNALLFKEGHGGIATHCLLGTLEDQSFRMFQYQYILGYGKSEQMVVYTVLEVTFAGNFPDVYLNNFHNRDLSGFKTLFMHQVDDLPQELKSRFKLYCPQGYEIEALQIFTPDFMALLQDEGWRHDTEFAAGKLYVYCENGIGTREQVEAELERVAAVTKLLSSTLNSMSYAPIGTLSPTL